MQYIGNVRWLCWEGCWELGGVNTERVPTYLAREKEKESQGGGSFSTSNELDDDR